MRDLNELGIRHFGGPPPPSPMPECIAGLEEVIGAALPSSYVSFLMYSNGGWPTAASTFYDRTEGSKQEWGVSHFFHLCSGPDSFESVLHQYRHRWEGAAREILPIADDGNGDLVCLELSESGSGRVIVWVHDDPDLPIVEVADSFEEFIDSLVPYSE
jgi:hypothetical protein